MKNQKTRKQSSAFQADMLDQYYKYKLKGNCSPSEVIAMLKGLKNNKNKMAQGKTRKPENNPVLSRQICWISITNIS